MCVYLTVTTVYEEVGSNVELGVLLLLLTFAIFPITATPAVHTPFAYYEAVLHNNRQMRDKDVEYQ